MNVFACSVTISHSFSYTQTNTKKNTNDKTLNILDALSRKQSVCQFSLCAFRRSFGAHASSRAKAPTVFFLSHFIFHKVSICTSTSFRKPCQILLPCSCLELFSIIHSHYLSCERGKQKKREHIYIRCEIMKKLNKMENVRWHISTNSFKLVVTFELLDVMVVCSALKTGTHYKLMQYSLYAKHKKCKLLQLYAYIRKFLLFNGIFQEIVHTILQWKQQ